MGRKTPLRYAAQRKLTLWTELLNNSVSIAHVISVAERCVPYIPV